MYEFKTEDAETVGRWLANVEHALETIAIALWFIGFVALAALITWWI